MFFIASHVKVYAETAKLCRMLRLLSASASTAAVLFLFCRSSWSADESPSPKDRQFTLFARQALVQDEELARFNVGVTVHNGVAHLWGTIPDREMIRRAAERVRQVPGLIDIRSDIRVASADDDEGSRVENRESKIENRESRKTFGRTSLQPRPLVLESPAAMVSCRNTPPAPAVLMPSIPLSTRSNIDSRGLKKEDLTEPTLAPGKLADRVLQVRLSDARYRWIQFEIREGTVWLWSPRHQGDDLFAMAQSVSRLPEVQRVIIQNTTGPRP